MKLNLFTCSAGGYLFAPECMLVSSAGQALHGQCRDFIGVLESELLPEALRRQIEADVDARAFAFVSQQVGDGMLPIRAASRSAIQRA
jgi:hypothetical protein